MTQLRIAKDLSSCCTEPVLLPAFLETSAIMQISTYNTTYNGNEGYTGGGGARVFDAHVAPTGYSMKHVHFPHFEKKRRK